MGAVTVSSDVIDARVGDTRTDGSGDVPDLSPRDAVERWLNKKRLDVADSTLSTYWHRLKLFVEWCESENIESIQDVGAWQLDEYDNYRRSQAPEKISLAKEFGTLRDFIDYCARVGLVKEDLDDAVDPPAVEKHEAVNTQRLDQDLAKDLIVALREDSRLAGSKWHLVLELEWFTGARMGALRGLDVGNVGLDVEGDAGAILEFHHRPETETPLKNDEDGERAVSLPEHVAETLRAYTRYNRDTNVFDDYGREPFITTPSGRPAATTVRRWTYYATTPCHAVTCPHGKDPDPASGTIIARQVDARRRCHHIACGPGRLRGC